MYMRHARMNEHVHGCAAAWSVCLSATLIIRIERSMLQVGPQRITFMVGAEAQRVFLDASDEILDQAPLYSFTIPVFGEGIVYDSPFDERLQQVQMLADCLNASSLEAMVPRMVEEAEYYFEAWEDEGTVVSRRRLKLVIAAGRLNWLHQFSANRMSWEDVSYLALSPSPTRPLFGRSCGRFSPK